MTATAEPALGWPSRQPADGALLAIKGHGTENDFLLIPDPDNVVSLTPELVAGLCDRRRGLGADGVLRVVRTVDVPEMLPPEGPSAAETARQAAWFMDYRNADGSVAEMCGNGLRVFVRYLRSVGLVEQDAAVATRGGVMRTHYAGDIVTVDMGSPRILADRPVVTAAVSVTSRHGSAPVTASGTALTVPNPHVVVAVTESVLDHLDLSVPPEVNPALPHGQNVEFVARVGERALRMRVHERGSGETRSCGTGICAAVIATAGAPDGLPWQVDVPGGRTRVVWQRDGRVALSGPAELLATVLIPAAERDRLAGEPVNR